jgi:hypothetical protein
MWHQWRGLSGSFHGARTLGTQFTTQFTRFTSTKVQILPPEKLLSAELAPLVLSFFCFTGTKVHILTHMSPRILAPDFSVAELCFFCFTGTKVHILTHMSPRILAPDFSVAELCALMDTFVQTAEAGVHEKNGRDLPLPLPLSSVKSVYACMR